MPLPRPAPGTARWWVVGSLAVLLAVAAITWWGIRSTSGSVRPEVTGYRVESDTSVVVEYDLHRPKGVAVVCRGVGLDSSRGPAGTVEDVVGATGPTSVHREVRIRTTVRAVSGVVDACTRVPAATP